MYRTFVFSILANIFLHYWKLAISIILTFSKCISHLLSFEQLGCSLCFEVQSYINDTSFCMEIPISPLMTIKAKFFKVEFLDLTFLSLHFQMFSRTGLTYTLSTVEKNACSSYTCQSLFFGGWDGKLRGRNKVNFTDLMKKKVLSLVRLLYYSCLWLLGFIFIYLFAVCILSIINFLFQSYDGIVGFIAKKFH